MRRRSLLVLAALLGAAAVTPGATASAQPTTKYIVTLRAGADVDAISSGARSNGATLGHVFRAALNGFSATLSDRAYNALRGNPNVVSLVPDVATSLAGTVQPNPPSQLDRIDQRALAASHTFSYRDTGLGVTAYVVDSGIRDTHQEVAGRVVATHDATGGTGADCNGHGTFVAGQVGGTTNGVAKQVSLVNVRVFGCSSGTAADLIAGIDWVTLDHDPGEDAVANVSILVLGGYAPLDTAVANAIADGVTFAVAAGNGNRDACLESPGRQPEAITVGAADQTTDARAAFSDYGVCVDLFAPGVSNTSASYTGDTVSAVGSGTSFAAPLTAGVAALYLQQNPGADPATVANAVKGHATQGVVTGSLSAPNDDLLFQDTYVTTTAYCDLANNVTGTVTYSATPGVMSAPVSWSWDVNFTCNHTPPNTPYVTDLAAGTYHVLFSGTSTDTCASGTGVGTISGHAKTAGNEPGTILPGGAWHYNRSGLHYFGFAAGYDGDFVLVDSLGWHRHYRMLTWFDYVPGTGGCPHAGTNAVVGHAEFHTE
jgi:subtilisin family serine protease